MYPSDTLRYAEAACEEALVRTTSLLPEAGGLALFLNGSLVDRYSGHLTGHTKSTQPACGGCAIRDRATLEGVIAHMARDENL